MTNAIRKPLKISLLATICALILTEIASAQPGNQTAPTYVLSKDFPPGSIVQSNEILASFVSENISFGDFDRFIHDQDDLVINGDRGIADNTSLGLIFRNYDVAGNSTKDRRRLLANYFNPSTDPTNCSPLIQTFATQALTVEDAELFLDSAYRTDSLNCPPRQGWIDHLVVRDSITLNNGYLTSDLVARLDFTGAAVKFNVEGNDNAYLFRTQTGYAGDIDLELKPASKLLVGSNLSATRLESNPLSSTNSSLIMSAGSTLKLNGALVSLVGDYLGRPGYDESLIDGATLEIFGNGISNAQLNLSVANINDSLILMTSRNAALRAYRLAFTGNNNVWGFRDASFAWKSNTSNEGMIEKISVDAGKTTFRCPSSSCSGDLLFDIYADAIDIKAGGTLESTAGVNFIPEALRLINVSGRLITHGALSAFGREADTALTQVNVNAGGVLELRETLRLPFSPTSTTDFAGDILLNANPAAAVTGLEIAPQGQISSRWGGANLTTRLNPSGWSINAGGFTFTDYADYVSLRHPTSASTHNLANLSQATVTVEAATPGLMAQQYADGGFDDPIHGKGTYNVLVSSSTDSGAWPSYSNGDRFDSVTLGPSMPAGLVGRVTRGLSDTEINTQPIGNPVRVIQIKLALSAGPFHVVYPDGLVNENETIDLLPTVTNGAGNVAFPRVFIQARSGAAFAGSYSIDGNGKLTLTPVAGDGGTCTSGNSGRIFDVVVEAERTGLTDPDAFETSLFELKVCAGSSISPYISYPNILATDNVAVGATVSKAPTVYGFTPTSFSVDSGSLPDGLTLDTSTGVISGTVTKAVNGADAAFTIKATGGTTTVLDPVTFVIDPTVSYVSEQHEIGTPFTSAAPVVSPYQVTSPAPASSFSLTQKPAGTWSVDVNGVISGTPEVFGDNVFEVAYRVGPDGANNEVKATLHLTVNGDPIMITYPPAVHEPGESVTLTPTITNNRDTVTWSVPANALPAGWAIDASSGVITGQMPQGFQPSVLVTASDKYTSGQATAAATLPPPATQLVTGGPGGVTATLTANGCTGIASASFVTPPDSPSKPRDTVFPYDLLDFTLTGCNSLTNGVTVGIQYSQALPPGSKQLFKEERGGYFQYGSTIGTDRVTFSLTDNGAGDDDPTPGTIHDPAGVGVFVPQAIVPVPTLTEWARWLLALLVLGLGIAAWARVDPASRNAG